VAEEKESRILESLLCEVSAEELLTGKLFGLGAVGLLTVGVWMGLGFAVSGPALALLPVHLQLSLALVAALYFLFGYLFFGSIMTGIGAVTNNMREAQQFAVWFTFANFVPFIMIVKILGHPSEPLAVGLSMFPPTAATAMMLRLTAPASSVPPWQIGLSIALLAGSAWMALRFASRVFRIGLLMYGKTPNLPEILRWARQG
jgi:ABC-2 type transport system permease protein